MADVTKGYNLVIATRNYHMGDQKYVETDVTAHGLSKPFNENFMAFNNVKILQCYTEVR